MPIKNFFSMLSLTPTHSSYPFLYSIRKQPLSNYSTGMSLNHTSLSHSPSLNSTTSTSLNCNLTQTTHDMPSGHNEHLGHLRTQMDDMPSGHLDTPFSYWPDDMPSSHPDSFRHFGHLGHLRHPGLLGHLGYLGTIGNLNTL